MQNLTIRQYNPLAELFIFNHIPYIVLFCSISCDSYTTYGIENGNDGIFSYFWPLPIDWIWCCRNMVAEPLTSSSDPHSGLAFHQTYWRNKRLRRICYSDIQYWRYIGLIGVGEVFRPKQHLKCEAFVHFIQVLDLNLHVLEIGVQTD